MIRKLLILVTLLTFKATALAGFVGEREKQTVSVAVMLLDNDEYGPERVNGYHHLVVGALQRAFKRSDMTVANAILPATRQPAVLIGSNEIDAVYADLDNEELDALVVLDAITMPANPQLDQYLELTLEWQIYDAHRQVVIGSHSTSTRIELDGNCDSTCVNDKMNRRYLALTLQVAMKSIADMQQYYTAENEALLISAR
ncbi:MAG: hypothetical protein O3B72_07390 [Proteobacteria bacterium]|nr:hypothetical protein [Pseudomonadota bacterium]